MDDIEDKQIGIELLPNHNNISISNGTITGSFDIGIQAIGDTNLAFKDLTIVNIGDLEFINSSKSSIRSTLN